MKKFLSTLILLVLLSIPLVSCGGDPEPSAEPTTTTQADPDAEMKSNAEDAVVAKLRDDGVAYSKIDPDYSKTAKDGDSYLVYIRTPMADGTTTETVYRATPVDGMWTVDDGEFLGNVE